MRIINYLRHEFTWPEPEARSAPLYIFVYDIPYFGACGIFPPLHIINQCFSAGGSQGGMSPGATWPPFHVSHAEYFELREAVEGIDPRSFVAEARYTHMKFHFDPEFDSVMERGSWFEQVCAKHRSAYHQRIYNLQAGA
jgi:hypothetical protein